MVNPSEVDELSAPLRLMTPLGQRNPLAQLAMTLSSSFYVLSSQVLGHEQLKRRPREIGPCVAGLSSFADTVMIAKRHDEKVVPTDILRPVISARYWQKALRSVARRQLSRRPLNLDGHR